MQEEFPNDESKPIIWIGSSLDALRELSDEVKFEIGSALEAMQWGRDHGSVKVMRGFGSASVREVRADDQAGTYRTVFTVEFVEAIYVLHTFQKKSKSGKTTPKEEIDRINRRLEAARKDHEERFG